MLVRLRLGLMEQDIAYRFNISQSTVSRIIITWINFMHLQLKELPLWPKKEVVTFYMPQTFKEQYPSTRVIINATEIFIEQPRLPEIQKITFLSYKNHNTYKALIGISPSGAIIFVSKLFSGSISDKELTQQSGLLDLLDAGDSVMADKGFDIAEYLIPRGVQLNIPPFLRGTDQFSHKQLVENSWSFSTALGLQFRNCQGLGSKITEDFSALLRISFFLVESISTGIGATLGPRG